MTISETPAKAPPVEDPYVGLTYFTEEYVDLFFGRDNESALIIGNLRASRLTLLYAESGVGKSSVLRAGVVARLRAFAESDREDGGSPRLVPVVFGSWSERPIAGLIQAIGEAIRPHLDGREAPELPGNDLAGAVETAAKALDGATLLIVLDQFEELFLYGEEDRVAAEIARCVHRPDLRANFLISIREDSYARLGDVFRGKLRNVYGNFLHLDFLDRAGGREAIEGPIGWVNEKLPPGAERFEVEPALVDAVLGQVEHDEAEDKIETTYLQLVMRRLWEEERGGGSHVLRLRTLERLGGAQKIISDHLDRAMEGAAEGSEALDDEQRLVAARVFRYLVTSGGTKIALSAKELADYTEIPVERIEPVLRHLSSSQLHILRPVVSGTGEGEQRFEIFHDALAAPINTWRAQVEDEERERERVEKEEAQRAAARAERRARVAQVLLAVAVVALIAGAVVFAIQQKDLADQREADNQSVRAAERIAELAKVSTFGPVAAALASVEDYRLSGTVEARNQALAQLQLNPGLPNIAVGHTSEALTVAYLPGSHDFVSGGSDGTIRLWDARGREIGSPLVPIDAVAGLAIGKPTGGDRILAAGMGKGDLGLWRLSGTQRPQPLLRLRVGSGMLWGVAFNPRVPDMLAVGSEDGTVTLWNLKHPRHPVRIGRRMATAGLGSLAFAADGRTLFVAGESGQAFGVNGKGFAAARPVRVAGGEEIGVATAPDGSYAFGGPEGIVLWDAVRGRHLHLRPPGEVEALEFADKGAVLVSAGTDRSVTTWDVASGRPFGPPRTFEKAVRDVAISSDGRAIAAAGEDSLVRTWPVRPRFALAATVGSLGPEKTGTMPEVTDLAVGSGGRAIAAAAGAAGTSIWPLRASPAPGSLPHPLAEIPGASYAVAYRGDVLVTGRGSSFAVYGTGAACPKGRPQPCLLAVPRRPYSRGGVSSLALAHYGHRLLLASSGRRRGEGVNLWDLSDAIEGGAVTHLGWQPVNSQIRHIALSPTEPLLAVGSGDGSLRLWDVRNPRAPEKVKPRHPRGIEKQPIDAVAFSPDGSLLASGGENDQVALWRVVRRGPGPPTVKAIPGTLVQGQSIFSLEFSPDGKTLAAGDSEGNTCLYELASRHLIGSACLLGHRTEQHHWGGVRAAEFARLPDGETVLLTAGAGQSIFSWNSILWNLSGDDGVEREITRYVCALAGRDLTSYEWDAIFGSTRLAGDRQPICRE
ncbi:MAG: WD40 repeat domain-containing protein [Solirubrobacterales bacterium]